MTSHDKLQESREKVDLISQVSNNFSELSVDIKEVMQASSDPMLVSALLYKLVKEREQTNKILQGLGDKFDAIMFELKQGGGGMATLAGEETKAGKNSYVLLPEQDQMILKFIEEHGQATANDIKVVCNYRGLNAASQRLNRLHRMNHLSKVQSGRKVVYLAKS